ncbi:hypothetical protein CR161_02525 [Prosthecochloris sp. ZM]|uniref:hypothetical protein n=1 Tax=Prosthecochloris sp. ZM TaxID=2283143 RepID=UPI000DF7B084|nr:hypothetical protein [Prosthecochloris sp. ZM]RDD29669.1 hypothetical protein CR161_02525 [Prosthecochloris sp. ZM]
MFYSAIAGLAFLLIPGTIEYLLYYYSMLPPGKHLEYYIPFLSSFGFHGIGAALSSALSGIVSAEVINKILDFRDRRIECLKRSIDHGENEFERLVKDAWESSIADSEQVLLSFTLKSREVYIGVPLELPVPSRSSHISLFPLFSGYLEKDTLKLTITDDHWGYYKEAGRISPDGGADKNFNPDGCRIVFSVDSIETASVFDLAYYAHTQSPESQEH